MRVAIFTGYEPMIQIEGKYFMSPSEDKSAPFNFVIYIYDS